MSVIVDICTTNKAKVFGRCILKARKETWEDQSKLICETIQI